MREIAEMVAGIRMDEVESKMAYNPEEYPEYTDGIEAERIITQELIEKYSLDDLSVRFHLSKGKLNPSY